MNQNFTNFWSKSNFAENDEILVNKLGLQNWEGEKMTKFVKFTKFEKRK